MSYKVDMGKEKIEWVDGFKTVGILAVILGHINSPFSLFIFSWHMPLFLMLAGFFIKLDKPLKENIVKDSKRLMVPYFLFAFIGLFAEILKRKLLHREALNYLHELKGIFITMDGDSLSNIYGFVLWFWPALFIAKLLMYFTAKLTKHTILQFGVVLLLFVCSFFVNIPFGIDNGMNCVLWIFIGYLYFQLCQECKWLMVLPLLIPLSLFVTGGDIPVLDIALKQYGNPVINVLFASGVTYLFIMILKRGDYSGFIGKTVKLWGGNTMLLFMIHPYTNNIAHIIIDKVKLGGWYGKFLISLILLQVIMWVCSKLGPKGILKYV